MNGLRTIGFVLAIGFILSAVNAALAAESVSVTRSDGTLDAFAVVPCVSQCAPGSFQVRHTAIAANGTGAVYSNDNVGFQGAAINLINAFWINSQLHVRAYVGTSVSEWIWGAHGSIWEGPFQLK